MANLLDRFNTAVRGAGGRIADYQSKIVASGDFKRITELAVILNSWNNILQTPRRTYIFDPEYGSELYRLVFEPADEETISLIENEVEDTLLRYDDRASITNLEVTYFSNFKGFNVNVEVSYRGVTGELSIDFDQDTFGSFLEAT
jgi:phage baseplate assembly protein W